MQAQGVIFEKSTASQTGVQRGVQCLHVDFIPFSKWPKLHEDQLKVGGESI